jgi:hypothetical protein
MFPTHPTIFLFSAQTFARPKSNPKLLVRYPSAGELILSLYISFFSIPIRPHFFVRLEVTRDPPLILAITFLSVGPRFFQLAQQSAQSFSPPSFISLSSIVTDSRARPSVPSSTSSGHCVALVLLHPPSSCALCFAPKPYTFMHMHSAPPVWP